MYVGINYKMFKKISYFLVFSLIVINSPYSQKPQPFDRQDILENHPELQKLSYSLRTKQMTLSPEVKQLLEGKGFKLLGQTHKLVSPRKDTLSTDKQLIRVTVSFDLKNSGYKPININAKNNSNMSSTSTDIIMTDGFEGDFPGTNWQRSGDPTWGKTDHKDHTGSYSIWCAKDGTRGVEPGNGYPDSSQSLIIYGPFDLSDVNYAQLKFWYWLDTEYEKDWFFSMVSTDGNNFQGMGMSGYSGAWDENLLHLNNVVGLGDVTGNSQVWIAFLFESDNHSSSDKGVYLDDIELNKRQINGTPLAGIVSGEFTTDGNPYIAVGDFGIVEDDTLEIKPGVEIHFEDGVEMIVLGLLRAIGSPSDSILFTSAKPNPSPGDWSGIGLYDVASNECRIQYCRIEYGGYFVTYGGTGASGIYLNTLGAEINNCLIWKNKSAGIWCGNVSGSTVKNCRIINNDKGVNGWLGTSTLITNNLIAENNIGVFGLSSFFLIKNNEIQNNKQEGIYLNTSWPIIVRNTIKNNGSHGIFAGGAAAQMSSGLTAIGNTIIDNKGSGILFDDFAISNDIVQNIVANNKSNGIDFSGIVIFDPYIKMYNNTVNNNNGYGIYYGNNSIYSSLIFNNIIANHPKGGIQFPLSNYFYIWYNDFYNNNPDIDAKNSKDLGIISEINLNGTHCDPYYNIYLEPSFRDQNNLNFELNQNSPCIDAGNQSVFYNDINGTKNDMGALGSSALYIYPTSYDFGEVVKGVNRETLIEIRNHRDVDFTLNSLQLSDNSNFSVFPSTNLTIPPYERDMIKVTFNPISLGVFSTTLTLFWSVDSAVIVIRGKNINGTIIQSNVYVSGKWSITGSPYLITGGITVGEGDSLIIEPGVNVLVQTNNYLASPSRIRIKGLLHAVGTETDSIVFTRSYNETNWGGLRFSHADSSSKVMYCIIEHSDEGGIYLNESDINIKHNTIQYNRSNSLNTVGGGISSINSNPVISNNTIRFNSTNKRGGGIMYWGLNDQKSRPIIEKNTIYDNWSDGNGGGLSIEDAGIVRNNIFFNNYAQLNGGGIHSGPNIYLFRDVDEMPLFQNNIIYKNSAANGGGICGTGNIVNNTITENHAERYGGGIYFIGASTMIQNSIVFLNDANEYKEIAHWYATVDINYSDIKGGWQGEGNIDVDPLFIGFTNNDYHLQSNSPCVDKGNPESIYNDLEDPNNLGFALYPALGTIRNDMGVYGGPFPISWDFIPYVDVQDTTISTLPKEFVLYQNYPNPFNSNTTIHYSLPNESAVTITIYDMLGRRVNQFLSEKQPSGSHSIRWNGVDSQGNKMSAGIYFYQIQASDFVQTKKMVLLK